CPPIIAPCDDTSTGRREVPRFVSGRIEPRRLSVILRRPRIKRRAFQLAPLCAGLEGRRPPQLFLARSRPSPFEARPAERVRARTSGWRGEGWIAATDSSFGSGGSMQRS